MESRALNVRIPEQIACLVPATSLQIRNCDHEVFFCSNLIWRGGGKTNICQDKAVRFWWGWRYFLFASKVACTVLEASRE